MFNQASFVKTTLTMVAGTFVITGVIGAETISLTRLNRVSPATPGASVSGVAETAISASASGYYPVAVAAAPNGAVYSVATAQSLVTAVSTGHKSTLSASPQGGSSSADHPAILGRPGSGPGQFNDPRGLAFDGRGNFYVADAGNNRVQKLSPTGSFLLQIGNAGSGKGELSHPYGVAVDHTGTIYVADTNNHRIVKFAADGAYLSSWGTKGNKEGQFFFPQALTLDRAGNVYVADFANNRIQKFTNDGSFLTAWGEAGSKPGQFNYPSSVAVDSQQRVWVTDLMNHRLQVFTEDGALITTVGSFGANAAASTEFNFPRSVAFAPNGDLWLAQPGVHAVDQYRVTLASTTASH